MMDGHIACVHYHQPAFSPKPGVIQRSSIVSPRCHPYSPCKQHSGAVLAILTSSVFPSGQEVRIILCSTAYADTYSRLESAFKPKKVAEGTKQYQLRRYAEQTLGSGNLRSAVALPEGEDTNEWIAVHGE
jgi:hypothetical protein